MAEFIAFVSGMAVIIVLWYWSSNDDKRQYRIGYRDGRFDERDYQEAQHESEGKT